MKDAYYNLAKYYDYLQKDIDYSIWQDFIIDNVDRNNSSTCLEIGCGTGKIANFLQVNGFKIDAFDLSSQMIEIAKTKHQDINFYVDNAITFTSETKFDFVISFMDTLNYIINYNDLELVFKNVAEVLNNGGLFLFDVHKRENKVYFDNYEEEDVIDNITFKWKSSVLENLMIHEMSFNDEIEIHKQYLYSKEEIKSCYSKYFNLRKYSNDEYKDFYVLEKK